MKSFYKYLNSRLEFGETLDVNRKPIFRSSAIFPAIQNNFYTTSILFHSYWLIKRNINEITILVTLRNNEGEIIKRNSILVNQPKSYSIELNSLLNDTVYHESEFLGSIELEMFSTQDMVFSYPALVLNYYGDSFNTCVHTLHKFSIYRKLGIIHDKLTNSNELYNEILSLLLYPMISKKEQDLVITLIKNKIQ